MQDLNQKIKQLEEKVDQYYRDKCHWQTNCTNWRKTSMYMFLYCIIFSVAILTISSYKVKNSKPIQDNLLLDKVDQLCKQRNE